MLWVFTPFTPGKAVDEEPHRSDNTVWQIYTIKNLLAETGDWDFLDKVIPYRDGGEASVYQHTLLGLQHIADRCGPHGLPTLFYADWNDSLALFGDEKAESVMLGMQLVHSCHEMAELATRVGKEEDARWCQQIADELTCQLNSDEVWDGKWYRRLLMSDGSYLGSDLCRQGKNIRQSAILVSDFRGWRRVTTRDTGDGFGSGTAGYRIWRAPVITTVSRYPGAGRPSLRLLSRV